MNPVLLRMGFARGGQVDFAMILGLAIAVPLYLAFVPFFGGLHFDQVTLPALVGYILGGLFGSGIGRRWQFVAIQLLGASPATAIKNSAPLITTMLAMLPPLRERVTGLEWLAIVSIILGITLVTWQPGGRRPLVSTGLLAAFGAAVSYGVRPLFLKFGLEQVNLPMTAALVGAITALTYAVVAARPKSLAIPSITRGALICFFVAGILQSLGFLALTFAVAADDVSEVYPVTSTAPLFTLAFTWLMLRGVDTLTWRIALGVVAVTAGVIVL